MTEAVGGAVLFSIGSFVVTAGALAGGLASLATSALIGSLTRPDSPNLPGQLNNPGAGRTTMVRQPITPHSIPYGRIKTSGPILFMHSQEDVFGRTFGDLYVVVALAGCKIKGIRTIYFGDVLPGDDLLEPIGSNPVAQLRFSKHLGEDDQVADADFVDEIGDPTWGENHRLRGIAYIAATLNYDSALMSHLEDISAVIDGVDAIYDPRTEVTGFTNNAALCIANWLTSSWGRNLAWSRLDEDSVIEAANICDERVLVLHGETEFTVDATTNEITQSGRSLDWGDGVRVSSTTTLPAGLSADTTYYVICADDERIKLATTVANAFAGTAIDITDAGTGTHTLTYWDEARYKLNGSFTLDTETGEVLDQMRSAMAGYVFPRGGKWFVHAGAAATPTVTLTADDLAGDITVIPKRSMRDRINGMRSVFANPDANWQPDDAPVLAPTAELLAEDAGEELYGDARYNFVTSSRQVQRLDKIALQRNRRQMTAEAPWKLTAMKLAPVDGVWLTIDRYFTSKQFRVDGWGFNPECTIGLNLQEDDADVYDWDAEVDEQEQAVSPGVDLPSGGGDPGPAITVETPLTVDFAFTLVSWAPLAAPSYDVQWAPAGTESWQSAGSPTTTSIYVNTESVAFDVRVRGSGVSGWSTDEAPGMPTSISSPMAGQITWTNDADAVAVQIFAADDSLYTTITGDDEATGLPADNYRLRSVSASGNISALSSVVPVS